MMAPSMSETMTDAQEAPVGAGASPDPAAPGDAAASPGTEAAAASTVSDFSERYGEVLERINATLNRVDWNQMGLIAKSAGILIAVIVAQILIKGVLDTINLLPVVPGLLELLGLVVVGRWSWNNLATSEKRDALGQRLQTLQREFLG
jgi:hypothetical protein